MIVIDLHYLAGHVPDAVISRRVRDLADRLHDTAMDMRGLDSACACTTPGGQKCPSC